MADFKLLLPDGPGIIGSLDEKGLLTFVILAGETSPIRGTEMFDLMMRAFGERVHGIRGVWRQGYQSMPSVNLDKVNQLTATGMSLEWAIGQTWTANRARHWGYSRVTVVEEPTGQPGAYSKVDVLFERL